MNASFMLKICLLLLGWGVCISARNAALESSFSPYPCPYEKQDVDTPAILLNYWEVVTDENLEELRQAMREKGVCGSTFIRFFVDASGNYQCYHLEKEDDTLISATFLRQTAQMKFRPGNRNDQSIKSWTQPIQFQVPCISN